MEKIGFGLLTPFCSHSWTRQNRKSWTTKRLANCTRTARSLTNRASILGLVRLCHVLGPARPCHLNERFYNSGPCRLSTRNWKTVVVMAKDSRRDRCSNGTFSLLCTTFALIIRPFSRPARSLYNPFAPSSISRSLLRFSPVLYNSSDLTDLYSLLTFYAFL